MLAFLACAFAVTSADAPPIEIKPGLVITRTTNVVTRTYSLPVAQGTRKAGEETIPALTPALIIRGNNITVNFNNSQLYGTPSTAEPDDRKGLGILVEGNNVTIRNLKVHGYKVGLMAKGCKDLHIFNSDFSHNWKQHLMSTADREDESDWQSYHHNEHDEWLRYGAGIYLEDCTKPVIKNNTATGGQCGLMLVRTNNGTIFDNDFTFLSGVGLGMYRSSGNRVMYNRLDWCVRGFSYGVYNRGQDSAGILIFEQCNDNEFAFNSVTHGGDGFFLWAGQTTMDTGKGGCNGNILYGNDFSHSPCNGIEATFSSNAFVNNKLIECWHGIWGGYSYDTIVAGNLFAYNGEAVSIEHGYALNFNWNLFDHENTAINLWSKPVTDKNWGYGKFHDTTSHDVTIKGNVFQQTAAPAIILQGSKRVTIADNLYIGCASALKQVGDNPGSSFSLTNIKPGETVQKTITPGGLPLAGTSDDAVAYAKRFDIPWEPFANTVQLQRLNRELTYAEQRVVNGGLSIVGLPNHRDPFLKSWHPRGQKYILVDEWGPYDFQSPRLVPRQVMYKVGDIAHRKFEILGPGGKWRLLSSKGIASISQTSGAVPGWVNVDLPLNQAGTTELQLEYVGGPTVDYRGITQPAGTPVKFGYSKFRTPIDWNVSFFKWNKSSDPRTQPAAFKAVIEGNPVKELKVDTLEFAGASFDPAVGSDHFATVANGTFSVPAGTYTLEVTTDDGARVWVDGKQVISDAWKYQGPTLYTAKLVLDDSKHRIRVEHFQIDGYAALKVNLRPSRK